MEELQRLQASRRGHRGHLTKLLKKSKEIIEHQTAIDDLTRALAETTLEQLRRKQDVLKEIDGNIQQKITEAEDLEAEITEAEGFQDEIAENIAQICVIIKRIPSTVPSVTLDHANTTPNTSQSPLVPNVDPVLPESSTITTSNANPTQSNASIPSSSSSNTLSPTTSSSTIPSPPSQTQVPNLIPNPIGITNHSRLPKLVLPTFGGGPLEWLSFWDSFNVAVNSKTGLSDIEKFNYLHTCSTIWRGTTGNFGISINQ